MSTARKTRRPRPPHQALRDLIEWSASAPAGSPLTVDRQKRVIYGVRVLGRFSRNGHGLREATNGTEYTRACMESALPLYEGAEVLSGHELGRRRNGGNDDALGVLRNVRVEGAGNDACVRADLHYFNSHPLTARVLEDVERGLGVFGLSHDASAGRERFDPASKRLVIESLAAVRSVDLVRKPATNRNLWESQPVSTTLREMLDQRRPKWSKARRLWADRLLEDDATAPAMDAPMDAPADTGDPDETLWNGFVAACTAILNGDGTAAEKGKKITEYLKAHEKLTGSAEPEAPDESVTEEAECETGTDKPDPKKTEAVKGDEAAALKHRLAVRDLFEDLGVRPDKILREAAENQPTIDAARRLIEREKARGGSPRSSGFGASSSGGGVPGPAGKAPATAKELADSIRD